MGNCLTCVSGVVTRTNQNGVCDACAHKAAFPNLDRVCLGCGVMIAGLGDMCDACFVQKPSPYAADMVNHPPHYKAKNGLEVFQVIDGFELDFDLGNLIKYVLRAGKKGDVVEDLQKARVYLDRAIAKRQGGR